MAYKFFGWVIVTITYLITWIISLNTLGYFLNDFLMKTFVGALLILLPYAIGGLYAGKVFKNLKSGAVWVSLVPMLSERVIIYLVSLSLVKERFHQWNYLTPIYYIQRKVFYFTVPYILLGILSMLVTFFVAKWVRSKRTGNKFYYYDLD